MGNPTFGYNHKNPLSLKLYTQCFYHRHKNEFVAVFNISFGYHVKRIQLKNDTTCTFKLFPSTR